MTQMTMVGAPRRWDQRAVAVVKLSGTSTDLELFEAEIQARDWRMLSRRPSSDSTLQADGECRYTVEVRFPGSALRAATAAREHLEVVSDLLVLDLVVEAVQVVERAPVDLPVWYVYAPIPTGMVPPRSWAGRLRGRVSARFASAVGLRDTGRQVRAGSESEALALAARRLPGVPCASGGMAVRRSMGVPPPPPPSEWPRRRGAARRLAMMRFPALVALVCGAWVAGLWGAGVWALTPAVPFALGALAASFMIARWALPEVTGPRFLVAGLAGPVLAAAFGAFAVLTSPDKTIGLGVVLVGIAAGSIALTGVWLWVRQSRWGVTLPWLLPALLAFLPGLLPGLGLSQQALYLDAFGVDLEDVDIPAAMRLLAVLKLLVVSLIWLTAPAILGYMRHLHYMVANRWVGYSAAAFVTVYTLVAGVGTVGASATSAGREAVTAAAAGRAPSHYYGIKPEWVCVSPIREVSQIPVDGGVLDPAHAYLSLGDASGMAVLWDPHGNATLKVPLSTLRLVPVDAPRRPCA
ncbi:hypothetical protein ABZ766_23510 [Streptomyces sp. NPDC006670]|uniref:hypothetical protein n=1 Tax=Streptomyces sp. NPDC006670 TaxID=3154476 RepID=UPI0034054ED1